MTCPNYNQGFCSKYNKHIPPSYCEWKCHKLPPLATQATNAIKAAGRILASGLSFVSDDVLATRQATCNTCEYWTNGRCSKCGCYTKAKLKLSTESCPEKKW